MNPSKLKQKCKKCERKVSQMPSHKIKCDSLYSQKKSIKKDYLEGISVSKLRKKYHAQTESLKILFGQLGVYRTRSQSGTLFNKLNPGYVKHTDETKAKMRKARLKYMKENPEKTNWFRLRTEMSYPEKLFKKLIDKNKLARKYDITREYPIHPYFTDFAFINIKVDFEIDGSQHWLIKERIKSDKKKEKLFLKKGWQVYRIPEFKLKNNFKEIEKDVKRFLNNIPKTPKIYKYENDIIEYEKIKKEKIARIKAQSKKYWDRLKLLSKVRKKDFKEIYPSSGWATSLGDIWGITEQRARFYSKKHFSDHFPPK